MTSKLKIVFLAGLLVGALPMIIVRAEDAISTPTSATSSDAAVATDSGGVVEGTSTDSSTTPSADDTSASGTSTDILTSTPADLGTTTASTTGSVATTTSAHLLVLQPESKLKIFGDSIQSTIELDNLSCDASCGKNVSGAMVLVYYTPWYPNNGPQYTEVGPRYGLATSTTDTVAPQSSQTIMWSADNIPPGHYYYVVLVDPTNALGAYQMQRTEFTVQ